LATYRSKINSIATEREIREIHTIPVDVLPRPMPGTTVEKLASEGRADSTTFTGLAGPSLLAVCVTIRENMGNITEGYTDGAGKKTVFSIHGLCFCYFKVARRLAVHIIDSVVTRVKKNFRIHSGMGADDEKRGIGISGASPRHAPVLPGFHVSGSYFRQKPENFW